MMNPLRRRFVNLVAENCTSGVCSLHRLDVSERLFYPSTAEAEAAKPTIYRLSLPPPACSFQPAVAGTVVDKHVFGLANPGISDSRILWSSPEGNTILYDADSHTARSLPSGLRYKGRRPIVISSPVPVDDDAADDVVEQEDLFVMSSGSGYSGFQVLRFDHSKPKRLSGDDFLSWEWERLPPPPLPVGSSIYAHAVLHGGRVICVSAHAHPCEFGRGTYLFDTARREWAAADDHWQMPFFGAAHFVPDLGLWLGVHWSGDDDSDRHHLCASSDLGAAVDAAMTGWGAEEDRPPTSVTVTRHWKGGGQLETPVGWETVEAQLIDLGGGRFCVAKIIDEVVVEYDTVDQVYGVGNSAALLTGVEMVRGRGAGAGDDGCCCSSPSEEEDGFRMVVHKSLRFIFCQESINWVL